jgi:hypothetical protein
MASMLPRTRLGETTRFAVGDQRGYLTSGRAPDGRIAEVTVRLAKQGTTLAGLADALGAAMTLGLQAGAPLHAFADDFIGTRFVPAGRTDDPQILFATSLTDYLGRRLTLDALPTT